jgi:hypothetical protein
VSLSHRFGETLPLRRAGEAALDALAPLHSFATSVACTTRGPGFSRHAGQHFGQ